MTASSPVEDKVRTRERSGIFASDLVRPRHRAATRSLLEDPQLEQRIDKRVGSFVTAPTYVGQGLVFLRDDGGIGLRMHARVTRT
jgi:hypothetical protein